MNMKGPHLKLLHRMTSYIELIEILLVAGVDVNTSSLVPLSVFCLLLELFSGEFRARFHVSMFVD